MSQDFIDIQYIYLVPSELEWLVAVVVEGAAGRGRTELQVAEQS